LIEHIPGIRVMIPTRVVMPDRDDEGAY
jgi:hypothetical protein